MLATADGGLRARSGPGRRAHGRGQERTVTLSLHFLGVGSAQAVELRSSGAVLERAGAPLLLIDCGPETLTRYVEVYNSPPQAVYVTHTHMDHVAGLERLFYRVYFDAALKGSVRPVSYTHLTL